MLLLRLNAHRVDVDLTSHRHDHTRSSSLARTSHPSRSLFSSSLCSSRNTTYYSYKKNLQSGGGNKKKIYCLHARLVACRVLEDSGRKDPSAPPANCSLTDWSHVASQCARLLPYLCFLIFFLPKIQSGCGFPAASHSLLPARRWSRHVPLTCEPAWRFAGEKVTRTDGAGGARGRLGRAVVAPSIVRRQRRSTRGVRGGFRRARLKRRGPARCRARGRRTRRGP